MKLSVPVQPRVGGEHYGPSDDGEPVYRFSPAWAGNTPAVPHRWTPRAVQPRVGGEHLVVVMPLLHPRGSAPRGRGTLPLTVDDAGAARFSPAWAGNTARNDGVFNPDTVQPRVGGEHRNRCRVE